VAASGQPVFFGGLLSVVVSFAPGCIRTRRSLGNRKLAVSIAGWFNGTGVALFWASSSF